MSRIASFDSAWGTVSRRKVPQSWVKRSRLNRETKPSVHGIEPWNIVQLDEPAVAWNAPGDAVPLVDATYGAPSGPTATAEGVPLIKRPAIGTPSRVSRKRKPSPDEAISGIGNVSSSAPVTRV